MLSGAPCCPDIVGGRWLSGSRTPSKISPMLTPADSPEPFLQWEKLRPEAHRSQLAVWKEGDEYQTPFVLILCSRALANLRVSGSLGTRAECLVLRCPGQNFSAI